MSDDNENLCTELSTLAADQTISTWDDDKRKEFVQLFKERSKVGCFLYNMTAFYVKEGALRKKFISNRHASHNDRHVWDCDHSNRNREDLMEIAQKRADAILAELPPLRDAIKVIDPATAKKLDQLEVLKKKVEDLFKRMNELSEPIDMADDQYQGMTVAAFREVVRAVIAQRKKVGAEIDETAEKGNELENQVNKALYAGIPGLSEAVVNTVKNLHERAKALDEVTRRIEERVRFGDSQAALDMLHRFEQDEVAVSEDVRAEFRKALDALKLPARKQLKGKGK